MGPDPFAALAVRILQSACTTSQFHPLGPSIPDSPMLTQFRVLGQPKCGSGNTEHERDLEGKTVFLSVSREKQRNPQNE